MKARKLLIMITKLKFHPYLPVEFLLRPLLVMTILIAQLSPILTPPAAAKPSLGVLQTIGDFLSLGANTIRELQEAIELASGETKGILQQLKGDIERLMNKLEEKFQDNVNYSLNSLDNTTWTILLQLEAQITTVNKLLQEDIRLISQEAKETIEKASLEIELTISRLEQSLNRTILGIGITGTFLIDKATYNVLLIIALVMLGLGLLIFIWLLFKQSIPSGLARNLVFLFIAVYLALFGSLLIPPVRVYALTFTGVGLEKQLKEVAGGPHVFEVVPDTIVLGETKEVEVWGSRLLLEDKTPTVIVDGINLLVKAVEDERIVVDVANLEASEGSTNLQLMYDGLDEEPRAIVVIVRPEPSPVPAELVITDFVIEPPSPVQQQDTKATIKVCNEGGSLAAGFVVQWKPTADMVGQSFPVPGADVGECAIAEFHASYPGSGTFDTVVIVDVFNKVDETDESNNTSTRSIIVEPAQEPPPPFPRPPRPQEEPPPPCDPRYPKCP